MTYPVILVMGVAGSGKTMIGKALAKATDAQFLDANDYHSKDSIAHMKAGKPLTDDMRWPWLDTVGDQVKAAAREQATVFACSALKRIYRDYLRAGLRYQLVYLDAPFALVKGRAKGRSGHGVPVKLLRKQYDTLNVPTKDENPICVDAGLLVAALVARIKAQLA